MGVHTTHCSVQHHLQVQVQQHVQVQSETKETQEKGQRRRMAAMAMSNYKRRMQQQQLMQKSESSNFNFNDQQQSTGGSDQGCFTSSQPTPDFTNGEGGNSNGTKKWSCDADGVTINTKWFPSSSTSRPTRRLSFSGQEFLS